MKRSRRARHQNRPLTLPAGVRLVEQSDTTRVFEVNDDVPGEVPERLRALMFRLSRTGRFDVVRCSLKGVSILSVTKRRKGCSGDDYATEVRLAL